MNKLPKFSLKGMTCTELATFLENPPAGEERAAATKIRERFAHWSKGLELLKKCGDLPARYHMAYIKTAKHLDHIPEVKMMVGGGKPQQVSMPRFSKTLKKMAEANGHGTLHRWSRGAFKLHQPVKQEES
jgi:hypothetical protein